MASDTPRNGRPGRLPGLVNLIAGVSLVVVLLGIALRANQASPPALAEFAPQAQQIRQAPAEQTSLVGKEPGAAIGPEASSPTPSPNLPSNAVLLRCVGDPPRQIEDPQSPPCIPYWEGNNGGATYKGVTASDIAVAVPGYESSADEPTNQVYASLLEKFFNERFELYGRRIRLISTTSDGSEPVSQAAAADARHVFASTADENGTAYQYSTELAKRGIPSFADRSYYSTTVLAQWAPYLWQYTMAEDRVFALMGEWICTQLANRPASHAIGTDGQAPPQALASKPARIFALVLAPDDPHDQIDPGPIDSELSACRASPVATFQNAGFGNDFQAQATTEIARMRQAGVTSVICLCHVNWVSSLAAAASNETYHPEWLTSSYLENDIEWGHQITPADQLAHMFGITVNPRQVAVQDRPEAWAEEEEDPSVNLQSQSDLDVNSRDILYRSLLELASGIQMAGPRLTPTTMAAGLHRTLFPNPDTSINAGHVGFLGDSYAMTIDFAEYWWDATQNGPYPGGEGAICYVDHGRRFSHGNIPATDAAFQGACDYG